jgi:hypothetical protein
MRNVIGCVMSILVLAGLLLVVGSMAAFTEGPEKFSEKLLAFYERAEPILPYFLIGVALIAVPIVLSAYLPEAWQMSKPVRCQKCNVFKGGHAKFCDQCGEVLRRDQPPLGTEGAPNAGDRSANAGVWDQVRSWWPW